MRQLPSTRKRSKPRPDYAEAHYNLGLALAGRRQFNEAITHYRQALSAKPDYAEAHWPSVSRWRRWAKSMKQSPPIRRRSNSNRTSSRRTTTWPTP